MDSPFPFLGHLPHQPHQTSLSYFLSYNSMQFFVLFFNQSSPFITGTLILEIYFTLIITFFLASQRNQFTLLISLQDTLTFSLDTLSALAVMLYTSFIDPRLIIYVSSIKLYISCYMFVCIFNSTEFLFYQ